jgi:hypothetical protein
LEAAGVADAVEVLGAGVADSVSFEAVVSLPLDPAASPPEAVAAVGLAEE